MYGSMIKLRRHDWRSHREVECNICGEILESRQNISCHRKTKHEIKTIQKCKFFPGCIDEEECFFKHEEDEVQKSRNVLCRFQVNCNRLRCSFKHNGERKAFLGVGCTNLKEK